MSIRACPCTCLYKLCMYFITTVKSEFELFTGPGDMSKEQFFTRLLSVGLYKLQCIYDWVLQILAGKGSRI